MFLASASGKYGPILIVGLSDKNVELLRQGLPINGDLRPMDLQAHLLIVHGKTELDIETMFRERGLIDDKTQGFTDPRLDQEAAAAQPAAREWPEGRLGAEDDGAIAMGVAADPEHGVVRIGFPKPVDWFAVSAAQARDIARLFLAKADEVDKPPESPP